jgi:hypothetical protein
LPLLSERPTINHQKKGSAVKQLEVSKSSRDLWEVHFRDEDGTVRKVGDRPAKAPAVAFASAIAKANNARLFVEIPA